MLQEKSEFMIEQHKETSSGNETKKDMKEEQQPQPILMNDIKRMRIFLLRHI